MPLDTLHCLSQILSSAMLMIWMECLMFMENNALPLSRTMPPVLPCVLTINAVPLAIYGKTFFQCAICTFPCSSSQSCHNKHRLSIMWDKVAKRHTFVFSLLFRNPLCIRFSDEQLLLFTGKGHLLVRLRRTRSIGRSPCPCLSGNFSLKRQPEHISP